MKKYILGGSLLASGLATVCGITGVIYSHSLSAANFGENVNHVAMFYQLAGIFGLLGIASFFVGWVFPADSATIYSDGAGGSSVSTTKVG